MNILYDPPPPHLHSFVSPSVYNVGAIAQCECGRYAVLRADEYGSQWWYISTRKAERLLRRARNRTGVV